MKKNLYLYITFLTILFGCGRDVDFFDNINKKPGVSTLVFPDNNENCTEGVVISVSESEVTFVWEASEKTDSYELFLTNLFTSETESYLSSESELAIVLLRGTPYSWYIVSISDSSAQTATSETWSFYNAGPGVVHYVPFPAEAISPLNGSEVDSATTYNLVWTATDLDDDIQGYDIYFGEIASPPLFQSDINETELTVTIVPGSTYFWKVRTKDAQGNASNSKLFTFEVGL